MITETLKTLRSEIVNAGTMRDGTATARCEVALNVLESLCRSVATPTAFAKVDAVRLLARRAMPFCRIHDKAARREIDGGAAYADALAAARADDARLTAQLDAQLAA